MGTKRVEVHPQLCIKKCQTKLVGPTKLQNLGRGMHTAQLSALSST